MLAYEVLAAGFVLLALGGETFLRGAIGLSKAFGLSPILIGLAVVSVGSSLPELSVAMQAATQGAPDIAVASIVGENILNILLIFGLAAFAGSVPCPPKIVFRDGGTMLVASLALAVIAASGFVSSRIGVILLVFFVLYLVLCLATDWRRPTPLSLAEGRAVTRRYPPRVETSAFLLALGMACLFLGGRFMVSGAVAIARAEQLPEALLGLTLVPAATAFPVLATTFVASVRGHSNVVAGQLVSANVLNILLVLGLTAVVHPLSVPAIIGQADAYIAAASAGVVVAMMLPGWRITRAQGALLFICYGCYLGFLAWRQGLLPI
jgi:cation:H+ antiporter